MTRGEGAPASHLQVHYGAQPEQYDRSQSVANKTLATRLLLGIEGTVKIDPENGTKFHLLILTFWPLERVVSCVEC